MRAALIAVFMAVLLAALAVCGANDGLAQGAAKKPANAPAYVGKWHTGDARQCKVEVGSPEGPIAYTATQAFGAESRCRIERAQKRGDAIALSLLCRAEGETSRETELLTVTDNTLTRTVTVEGKRMTFKYARCP